MKLGEILRAYREEHGLSLRQMAEAAGVSHTYISGLEKSPRPSQPTPDTLERLAGAMGMTYETLLRAISGDSMPRERIRPVVSVKTVPFLGRVACGLPILATDEADTHVALPAGCRADFCVEARGDSMIGARIRQGDLIFVRAQPDVENGELAVVRIGDEATLKRVYRNGRMLVLAAENPAYPPLVYAGEDLNDVTILGKPVSFYSTLD